MRPLPTSGSSRRSSLRGFTLIELMVVVVIIGILATIAVPLFAERMRARRGLDAAQRIADIYRAGRTRALGRGAAVMVSANNAGDYVMLEGVEGTTASTAAGRATCGNLPTRGCTTNNWVVGSGSTIGTARQVTNFVNGATTTVVGTMGGNTTANLHICFSPSGRAFVNQTGTWTANNWQPLTDVVTFWVTHNDSQRFWDVLVLPNGTSRLGL